MLPFLRPDWTERLEPGDAVDAFDRKSQKWGEALVVSANRTRIVVAHSTSPSEPIELEAPTTIELQRAIQPHLSQVGWGQSGAVQAGDYVEIANGATTMQTGDGGGGGWQLSSVLRRLEATDPRNNAGETLFLVQGSDDDDSEEGKWVPGSATAPCGTNMAFSDTPHQILVLGNLVGVLLTRVSASSLFFLTNTAIPTVVTA